MNSFFRRMPHGPTISTEAQAPPDPEAGGVKTKYRVEGIWREDGSIDQPKHLVIEMDEGRVTERPGDTISLTRLEHATLGRTVMLTPVFE